MRLTDERKGKGGHWAPGNNLPGDPENSHLVFLSVTYKSHLHQRLTLNLPQKPIHRLNQMLNNSFFSWYTAA